MGLVPPYTAILPSTSPTSQEPGITACGKHSSFQSAARPNTQNALSTSITQSSTPAVLVEALSPSLPKPGLSTDETEWKQRGLAAVLGSTLLIKRLDIPLSPIVRATMTAAKSIATKEDWRMGLQSPLILLAMARRHFGHCHRTAYNHVTQLQGRCYDQRFPLSCLLSSKPCGYAGGFCSSPTPPPPSCGPTAHKLLAPSTRIISCSFLSLVILICVCITQTSHLCHYVTVIRYCYLMPITLRIWSCLVFQTFNQCKHISIVTYLRPSPLYVYHVSVLSQLFVT